MIQRVFSPPRLPSRPIGRTGSPQRRISYSNQNGSTREPTYPRSPRLPMTPLGRCGSCVILQFSMKMITRTCCTQLREKVALLLRFCTDLHAVRRCHSPYPYVAIRISPFISALEFATIAQVGCVKPVGRLSLF